MRVVEIASDRQQGGVEAQSLKGFFFSLFCSFEIVQRLSRDLDRLLASEAATNTRQRAGVFLKCVFTDQHFGVKLDG